MTKNLEFDLVVIGSSPISLINVLEQHKKNKRFLILDKKRYIGGNWSVSSMFGYNNVETGPHYIKVRKNEHKIFSRFNIDFEVNTFKPIYLIKSKLNYLKLRDKNQLFSYMKFSSEKKCFLKIIFFLKFIFSLFRSYFNKNATIYIYPKNGCKKLLSNLEGLLKKVDVKYPLSFSKTLH